METFVSTHLFSELIWAFPYKFGLPRPKLTALPQVPYSSSCVPIFTNNPWHTTFLTRTASHGVFQPLPTVLENCTIISALNFFILRHVTCYSHYLIPTHLSNPNIKNFLLWDLFSESSPCLGLLPESSCSRFSQHPVHPLITVSQHLSNQQVRYHLLHATVIPLRARRAWVSLYISLPGPECDTQWTTHTNIAKHIL